MEERDFRYLWAAYRQGAFDDWMLPELDSWEFGARMLEVIEAVDHEWILEAELPVGLILGTGQQRTVEPHVAWFPWATPRNKLETLLAFCSQVAKRWKLMVFARPEDKPFFVQMCRYGQLTMGCKIHELFPESDGYLFYTRGPNE